MRIRNRIADVVKLRCNVCQDFLEMVLPCGWQESVYSKAATEVRSNSTRGKYIAVYEKMRDKGISNFCVQDMDVTFIWTMVSDRLIHISKETRDAIRTLKDDRNLTNHSSENESDEELYLRAILALCHLRDFVKIVDRYENSISDSARLDFRKKYIQRIAELMQLLYDEQIALVQIDRAVRKQVDLIKNSDNPYRAWFDIKSGYWAQLKGNKTSFLEDEQYFRFCIEASDAGIASAHIDAAGLYFFRERYDEGIERLIMYIDSKSWRSKKELEQNVLAEINIYIRHIRQSNSATTKMLQLIDKIRELGFNVKEHSGGTFELVAN